MNWNRVSELRDEVGPEAFGEVLALFLEETDQVAARLSGLQDLATLGEDLHFLKGAALNLGFDELAKACQASEMLIHSGRETDVDIPALLACYTNSLNELNTRRDELGLVA